MDEESENTGLPHVIEFKNTMQELSNAVIDFQKVQVEKLENMFDRAYPATSKSVAAPELWLDTKTGQKVPALAHHHRVADYSGEKSDSTMTVGRMLRGIALGQRADDHKSLADEFKALGIVPDVAGGYTVPWSLSSQWIDLLRARMVLSQAGARTVPMPSRDLTIAKVTSDPAVVWHQENDSLEDSEVTFGAVTLTAKTVVCLVKFSLELGQDSVNLESILESTLNSSLSRAIDSAGLVGVTEDAAAAPSGIFNLDGRNTVTAIGAPTNWDFAIDGMYELLAKNVQPSEIGAMIGHPKIWKKMAKLKTGIASDSTPLPVPPEVAKLPKLWTTAAPLAGGNTAKAVIADWRDLLFGIRKDVTVRVLQEAFLGTNLQLAMLAYARVAFVATRADSFCTLEGITV